MNDEMNMNENESEIEVIDLTSDESATESGDAETSETESGDSGEVHPWRRPGQWFVVHTQAGYEKKVKANLEARIQSMNVEDRIFEAVIPMEDVVEFKNGRKQTVQKKVFPGYLLVRCIMDDESWYCIRNTPVSPVSSARARRARSPRRCRAVRSTPSCRPRATVRKPPIVASPSSSTRWARACA